MSILSTSNNDLYKSFKTRPYLIQDSNNKTIDDPEQVLKELEREIRTITDIVEWSLGNDKQLLDDIDNYDGYNNASKIGIALGLRLPEGVIEHQQEDHYLYSNNHISKKEYDKRIRKNKGNSRREWLYHRRLIDEASSWLERMKAVNGDSDKYISSGWSRTVNAGTPSCLKNKISLSITDKQYAKIINNPFIDGFIVLKMVINGKYYYLYFNFDNDRFSQGYKVCLPDIITQDNKVVFVFSVAYSYIYKNISSDYFIGVDVNISTYAVVVVMNKDGVIVHSTTLSRRVHSLTNSIKATSKQVKYLRAKRCHYNKWDDEYKSITREIEYHRSKNINKKRELAILAGQEIAYLSYIWGNAVVGFEDLSWIDNTMQNGRWNRGELVKRTTEYVELNGSRVIKVDASNTSKKCCYCDSDLIFNSWHDVYCSYCDLELDRDVNAACNVSRRMVSTVSKMVRTRSKGKNYQVDKDDSTLRTPVTRDSLNYKKSDRSKSYPTGKCENKKRGRQFKSARLRFMRGVNDSDSAITSRDDLTVLMDEDNEYSQDSRKATSNYVKNILYCLLT